MKLFGKELDWKERKWLVPGIVVGAIILLLLVLLVAGSGSGRNADELLHDMRTEQDDLQEARTFMEKHNFSGVGDKHRMTGYAPMHLAVMTHNLPVMRGLLKLGANINATDRKGNTPLDLAIAKNRHEDVARWLRDNGATTRNVKQ